MQSMSALFFVPCRHIHPPRACILSTVKNYTPTSTAKSAFTVKDIRPAIVNDILGSKLNTRCKSWIRATISLSLTWTRLSSSCLCELSETCRSLQSLTANAGASNVVLTEVTLLSAYLN